MNQWQKAILGTWVAVLLVSMLVTGSLAEEESKRDLTPAKGFNLYDGDRGRVDFSFYTYLRYLNQRGLDDTYINAAGETVELDQRDDLQFQKGILYFKGWLGTPKFRYLSYVWTSNTSQGLGAQVVLAGNLTYRFNEHVTVGGGIGGLPTTRTTRGTFPFWAKQDNRTIGDEFFRGSYTSGIWAEGDITDGLHYKGMLGDNLSQLGVDAGQLAPGMNTLSGALWWTGGGFGTYEGFGDFDGHEALATNLGTAFTASRETRQNQPRTEDPENTQIRLSNGTGIFQPGAFGEGLLVEQADYRMSAFDGALKYRGYALEGDYYIRWVQNLKANGPLPVDDLYDHGFQAQASAMVIPQTLMLYGFTSRIFGEYGIPWDAGGGINYYPFKTRILRFNPELIYVDSSPVGYLSYPLLVGSNGPVFMMNIELFF